MTNVAKKREFTDEFDAAVSVLRALVASKKGPSTVQSILADFRELEGSPLMYKKFGFPNADEFLKCTGEFVLQNRMGETIIYVKPSKESAHILKMVAAQRPSKTRKSGFSVMRQPQKNYGGSNWNPSVYNKIYTTMPYQSKRYPQNKYLPHQQVRYNNTNTNPLKQVFQSNQAAVRYNNNRNYGTTQNSYSHNQPKSPLQQQNVVFNYQRVNQAEPNNNNSTAKNLNKSGQPPTYSLKLRSNEQPKQSSDGFKQSRDTGYNNSAKTSVTDTSHRTIEANQPFITPPSVPNVSYPSPPVRSVNTRLQIVNHSSPTAAPMLEPAFPKPVVSNNSIPRQEFPPILPVIEPITLILPPPPPVIQLPTLPGQKTLQDRLKMNQKVDSADLEKVAKIITPQSSPAKTSDPGPKVLSAPPVAPFLNQSVLHAINPGATPVELLASLAQSNKFAPPVYKYYKLKNKRFQCRVTINGSTYACYPNDFANEFEAQFAAAQIAIDNIKRDEERNSYSVCLDSDYEVALKIFDLLVTCSHGMFSKNIPNAFRNQYKALLPDHWESIILSHTRMFTREETASSTIVYANVREANPEGTDTSNTSEATRMKANLLTLPWQEKYWSVYVTNPVSTVEIWARLVGPDYSDKMDALLTDIELHMMDEKPKPKSIVVGEYYLVCTNDCWFRVRAEELDFGENICLCFFIDIGDWERVSLNDIFACKSEYLELPAQSVCFTLHGLEDFGEHPKSKPHLDNLISGKVCIGEILTAREDYEKDSENDAADGRIQMILYDTSSEEDINLNSVILKQVCDDMPTPELNRKSLNSVIITHVDEFGDVHCQLKDDAMVYIQKLITNLVLSNALEAKHRGLAKTKSSTGQQLYLVRKETDKKWYRASFVAESSASLCKMLLVDVGVKELVDMNNIYRLETLSVALNRYPAQAIQMRMFNMEEMNDYLLCRLRALLKPGLTAMVKVAAYSSVPLVKIYMHAEPNNILVCINDSIRTELELEMNSELISSPRILHNETTSSSGASSAKLNTSFTSDYSFASQEAADISKTFNNLKLSSSPVPSQVIPKLPKFQVPAVGQRFDVNVTIASSPNYFIVQPYMQAIELQRMMVELQKYCMTEAKHVPKDSIEKGEAYAGLNSDDGNWYRVLVVNILCGPTSIHVYFCDFGQIRIMNSESLRILPQNLRKLPQQAVKAKLYGVQPLHTDWSAEDAVRFQQLTVEKKFAGQVRSIHVDEINPNDDIVELTLIDVSTDEDTLIHQVLVNEKRAIFTGR